MSRDKGIKCFKKQGSRVLKILIFDSRRDSDAAPEKVRWPGRGITGEDSYFLEVGNRSESKGWFANDLSPEVPPQEDVSILERHKLTSSLHNCILTVFRAYRSSQPVDGL